MTADTKRAIVTGAASGLGAATARVLRAAGWRVAAIDLVAVDDVDVSFVADVSDESAVGEAVARAIGALGGADGVVHAAGVALDATTPVDRADVALLRRTLDVNAVGAYLVARAALPALVESSGSLVIVGSVVATTPQTGAAAYAMSKAAAVSLARSVALEYARFGVRANSVSPGYMDTAMSRPVMESSTFKAAVEASIPLSRVAAAEEVADVIAWLLSPAAGYVTGEDVVVDGAKRLTSYSGTEDTERLWRAVETREST